MARRVSQAQVAKSLAVIARAGAQSYHKGSAPSFAQCIGMALSPLLTTEQAYRMTAELLEDHNKHGAASTLRAWAEGRMDR